MPVMILPNEATPRKRADDFHSTPLGSAVRNVMRVVARIGDGQDAPIREFKGRCAWMLCELVKAGAHGVTTLENPAPRVSDYLHKLRRRGVAIETRYESHSGAYSGAHGRFVLAVPVSIIETECSQ